MSDFYCPPPTDRLCGCRQCRAEWEARERELLAIEAPKPVLTGVVLERGEVVAAGLAEAGD